MLDCAHFDPGLASIVYSSACVGSTSYFVVYAEVASQGENRQGAGIREGADQRYFTVIVRRDQNERAWKLRALRYAVLPSSSCMLLELMEMLFTST